MVLDTRTAQSRRGNQLTSSLAALASLFLPVIESLKGVRAQRHRGSHVKDIEAARTGL